MATTKLYLDTRGSAGENGSVKVVMILFLSCFRHF